MRGSVEWWGRVGEASPFHLLRPFEAACTAFRTTGGAAVPLRARTPAYLVSSRRGARCSRRRRGGGAAAQLEGASRQWLLPALGSDTGLAGVAA